MTDPFLLTVIKIKANHTRGEEMFLNGGFDPGNMGILAIFVTNLQLES